MKVSSDKRLDYGILLMSKNPFQTFRLSNSGSLLVRYSINLEELLVSSFDKIQLKLKGMFPAENRHF